MLLSDFRKVTVWRRAAGIFIARNAPIVIALDEPRNWHLLYRPLNAFDRLRAVIDQVAQAENLVCVFLSLQDRPQGRPVRVNVRENEKFHGLVLIG